MSQKHILLAAASLIAAAAMPASAEPGNAGFRFLTEQIADEPGTPPARRVVVRRQEAPPPPPTVQQPVAPIVLPPYEPYGYFGVGGVFMTRNRGANRTIVVNDAVATFIPVVSTRDLGTFDDFKGGIEAKGGVRIAERVYLAFRFLWISEFNSLSTGNNPNDFGLPFINNISTNFDGANTFSIRQESNFHTLSVGPQFRVNRWLVVGAGFRYARSTDNIFIVMNDGSDANYDLRTRNLMFGGEVNGLVMIPITERIELKVTGAAAFLYNSARVSNFVFDPDDARANRNVSDRRGGFSFLGEVGLTGSYKIEHWLKLYVGYRFLFLTGQATAANNLDFNSTAAGITQSIRAERGANVYYHGGVVGLKVVF